MHHKTYEGHRPFDRITAYLAAGSLTCLFVLVGCGPQSGVTLVPLLRAEPVTVHATAQERVDPRLLNAVNAATGDDAPGGATRTSLQP